MSALEDLVSAAMGETAVSEVIRPAAILSEQAAHAILMALLQHDVRNGGCWESQPNCWQLWNQPWNGPVDTAGTAILLGTIQVTYGVPTRHEITIHRASITLAAVAAGITIEELCNHALRHAGLDIATCPRAVLRQPPRPFRHR